MLKADLLKLIEGVEDGAEIDNLIKETDLYKSSLSLDNFKNLINVDENYKRFMDSEKDIHFNKALSTWKENNLKTLIDAEIAKSNPQKSPLELKLEALEKRLEDSEREKTLAEMKAQYKDIFNEKGIPGKIGEFLFNSDRDVLDANITLFENELKELVNKEVAKRYEGNQYTPPKDDRDNVINPWSKATFNLTEQAKILTENPALAETLKASAVK